jgi:hypothetical protein
VFRKKEIYYMSEFFIKIKNGFKIMLLSFKLFFKRPKYLFFPILNILFIALFFSLIFIAIHFTIGFEGLVEFLKKFGRHATHKASTSDHIAIISMMISIGLVCSYFFTLISAAVSLFSVKALEGSDVSVSAAVGYSFKKSWIIIQWVIVNMTIGIILGLIKDKNNWLAKIISDLAGITWKFATFFIFPIIALENLNIFLSIRHSAVIMKKTFGESISIAFSFGFIELLILVIFPLAALWLTSIGFNDILIPLNIVSPENNPSNLIGFISPTIFLILFLMAIMSTIKTIFKTAVYAYCTNRPTGIFPKELIASNFSDR